MTKPFNFEEAMARLSVIAQELEKDDLSMDTALSLFEEGLNLSKQCQDKLNDYEKTVRDLVNKHQGDSDASAV